MKTRKIRFLALMLSILLIASMLPPAAFADEPADELTQETIDRVYDEVLSGEITSTEDVLRVALAQYEARQTAIYGMHSRAYSTENDDTLRITQVLDKSQDEGGSDVYYIADTALLVTDETGNVTTARHANQDFLVLDQYGITAQHTVYYYYKFVGGTGNTAYVKIYKQVTTLQASSSTLPTALVHEYRPFEIDDGWYLTIDSQQFSYPGTGNYTTYPPSADWVDAKNGEIGGFESAAIIYYGSTYYEFGARIHSGTVGNYAFSW